MIERLLTWMPAAALAGVIMMAWLMLRRLKKEAPFVFEDVPPSVVTPRDTGLGIAQPNGDRVEIAWDDVSAVRIRTTEGGPLFEDVFWEFETRSRGEPVVVGGGSMGIDAFLACASEHLPGFDHETVISAMGSTERAVFVAWPADAPDPGS